MLLFHAMALRFGCRLLPVCLLWCCAIPTPLAAESFGLTHLSLEELMDVEIELVSRKAEPLFGAPAATFVLTGDELRRSGATTIPEALRLVPGLVVARIDANKWAISARGLTGRFANKLLVQIDGRSVYTPLFSGVFWEVQDVFLEDVERIEVIRGPGATLWGSNAVNGIINIVTRHSEQTQGVFAQAGTGTVEPGHLQVRYGARLGEHAQYRLYARIASHDAFDDPAGDVANDDWKALRTGGRFDYSPTPVDALTLTGDIYSTDIGQTYLFADLTPPYTRQVEDKTAADGGHAMARWEHSTTDGADLSLQLYFDHTHWSDALFIERRSTYDLDFQHRLSAGRADFVWGIGGRYTTDTNDSTSVTVFDPRSRGDALYSAFVQYDRSLRHRMRVVLGAKLEHNDYSGYEWQPNARLIWTPSHQQAVWTAVSRAVRTPSRAESDVRLIQQALPPGDATPVALLAFLGSPDLDSEPMLAYEAGYRFRYEETLSLDLALFFNDYDGLRGGKALFPVPGTAPGPVHLIVPFVAVNNLNATTRGLELAIDWRDISENWRTRAIYSWLSTDVTLGVDLVAEAQTVEEETPTHQVALWHSRNLGHGLQLDVMGRYVSEVAVAQTVRHEIDAYAEADLRLAWQPSPTLELALVGRNLFGGHPAEYKPFFVETQLSQIPRSGKLTLSYRP
ncbi:MAG: TonB-dependent receptor [Gemmatimonadetes bacterium]|jgi:iron complex outermembrane recepter protein|nr:TonB-dependent receptor [Gemmatimonadota bacterium]MBT7859094.1 TonB-dependent receptor [Gemmatimonadota bacterium]